ncbi:MAG: head-tail adaptor protein [Pseudomonadota bacterium]
MTGPIDPGVFNLRMAVLEPVTTDDGMGGGVQTLVEQRQVWAQFVPDAPTASSSQSLRDTLGAGTITMRAAMAPDAGWLLRWTSGGISRTVEVEAVEPGQTYDRCRVKEVAR